ARHKTAMTGGDCSVRYFFWRRSMLNVRKSLKSGIAAIVAASMAFGALAPVAAMAQDRDHHDEHDRRGDHRGPGPGGPRPDWRGDRHWDGPAHTVAIRPFPEHYRPIF